MRDARWIELFERYRSQGDVEALARLFDEVAPSLLKVARHIDSRRGEAEDLVQTTFLVAIERSVTYDATRPLVPWLMGILINQSRIARRRRKELVDGGEHETSSESTQQSDMESSELAKAVAKALSELPETYREVLIAHLQEGKKPRDIARELGRPQGTVRAQLHRGLRLMRDLLPASFALGFIGLLAPHSLAAARRNVLLEAGRRAAELSTAAAPGVGRGAVEPALRTSIGAQGLAVLLVLLSAGIVFWVRMSAPSPPAPAEEVAQRASTADAALEPLEADVRAARAARVRVLAAEPGVAGVAAERGSIVVRVGRLGTDTPVEGASVSVLPWSEERWYDAVREGRTRADGSIEFTDLVPGLAGVHVERGEQSRVEVLAGRVVELTVVIHPTIALAGVVVDERGAPVANAEVALYFDDGTRTGAEPVRSGPDGRFEFARAEPGRYLGACAEGFGASALLGLSSPTLTDAARRSPVLVLDRRARSLSGRVLDADGSPLAGARIRASRAQPPRVVWRADGFAERDAPPVETTSSADGAYALVGLAQGPVELEVRLDGFAPWSTTLGAAPVGRAVERRDVRLERGALVSGRLTLASGGPAVGAEVVVDDGLVRAKAGADGRFEARVPSGGHVLRARRDRFAAAVESHVLLVDGETRAFDAELPLAPTIRGVALGPTRTPLAGVLVRCARERLAEEPARSSAEPWADPKPDPDDLLQAVTNARGEFELPAYAGRLHTLEFRRRAHWRGPVQARMQHVPAGRTDVELVAGARSGWLVGQVLEHDGKPVVAGEVLVLSDSRTDSARAVIDAANGCFRIGPLFPGTVRMNLCRPGEPPIGLGTFEVVEREEHDTGALELLPTGRVELRGAGPLTLRGADGVERQLVAGDDERWTSERVPQGTYAVLRNAEPTGAVVHVCAEAPAVVDVE
ncbi:MAG: sigma-70 family RNA polymerase sigma factor [Planctomycetes bacterium]|nr:sigma-70 family RNA polymerase sigma factor [Planctomycetota bacterium]